MIISDNIMKIVDKKEKDKRDFKRCLNSKVCPKCGADLTHDYDGTIQEYICRACTFKYTR